jgi:hypothetical protein
VLSIGHKQLPGFQREISHPFPAKRYGGSTRQDLVFVRPPDAGKDFRVQCGIAEFRSCFPFILAQTLELSTTPVRQSAFVSVL